ncbi:MAG: hypothetical protein SGJ21_00605 [Alphaproteobacteria bacterium]|nr:hypothetical protein [Alphaproteobacteria bacterium]
MVELFRGRARLATGAIALAITLLASSPAWGQACPTIKGKNSWPASLEVSMLTLREVKAVPPEKFSPNREKIEAVLRACVVESAKNGKNAQVQMCIGDAAALLARDRPADPQFLQAECAYLAAVNFTRDAGSRADASEGRAKNLEAWGGRRDDALRAWLEAVKVETAARRLALAKLQKAMGRLVEADASYSRLSGLPTGPGLTDEQKGNALREQARLQRDDLGKPRSVVRPVWEESNRYGETSEAYYEIGMSWFDNDSIRAADAFRQSVRLRAQPGAAQPSAQSYYYLAAIGARTANTSPAWKLVLEDASNSLSDPRAKRLACLAHIAAGESSLSASAESPLCQPGPTPAADDLLLRGAYQLRRMQFLPGCETAKPGGALNQCSEDRKQRFVDYANWARESFRAGQSLVVVTDPPAFDWLLQGEAAAPIRLNLLKSGEDLANSITQTGRGCGNISKPVDPRELDFFARLDLLSCTPTRRGM